MHFTFSDFFFENSLRILKMPQIGKQAVGGMKNYKPTDLKKGDQKNITSVLNSYHEVILMLKHTSHTGGNFICMCLSVEGGRGGGG